MSCLLFSRHLIDLFLKVQLLSLLGTLQAEKYSASQSRFLPDYCQSFYKSIQKALQMISLSDTQSLICFLFKKKCSLLSNSGLIWSILDVLLSFSFGCFLGLANSKQLKQHGPAGSLDRGTLFSCLEYYIFSTQEGHARGQHAFNLHFLSESSVWWDTFQVLFLYKPLYVLATGPENFKNQ